MRRTRFLATATAAATMVAALPRVARATGGLDTDTTESTVAMRVLLATGTFDAPQQLDAWHFAWNGRTYRGAVTTVTLPGGKTGLLNTLPLDAYLGGVLGSEISASWTPAAQRAQAIASRTYALGKIRPEKAYDVVASESDQHYGGIAGESVECRAAIDATAGQIVTFGQLPARVAYSSCCGGRTADAGDVWKTPYAYLISMDDPNCSDAPNYAWSAEIPRADLDAALGGRLTGTGSLRDVRLDVPAPDARPSAVAFVGDARTIDVPPAEVRTSLGTARVRSTFIRSAELAPRGALTLGGTGRGHGVGLCQWGARGMGERGASAAEILAFYFPGTALGHV